MGPYNEQSSNRLPLKLIQALVGALSHKIRTPLSVIQNDLSYLSAIVPSGECARPLERCKEISAILKGVRIDGASDSSAPTLVDLATCIRRCGWSVESKIAAGAPGHLVDETLTAQIFGLITQLIERVGSAAPHSKAALLEQGSVSIALGIDPGSLSNFSSSTSLTALVCDKMHLDSVEAPLIDALALAMGWTSGAILQNGQVNLKFTL